MSHFSCFPVRNLQPGLSDPCTGWPHEQPVHKGTGAHPFYGAHLGLYDHSQVSEDLLQTPCCWLLLVYPGMTQC